MCTVVARWSPEDPTPIRVLALRDELATRDFDVPGTWWPDSPHAFGGRDRRAGGTWCAGDVARGITAVVLNRPERREGLPGAASRGVLPLLALEHGDRWADHVEVTLMAGFNLVLLGADAARWWSWDGTRLTRAELPAGTHQFKPTGLTDEVPARLTTDLAADLRDDDTRPPEEFWGDWLAAVRDARPSDDGSGLLVRVSVGEDSYETVFGQLIAARPGLMRLDYRARVARADGPWTTRVMVEPPGSSQPGSRAQRWVS